MMMKNSMLTLIFFSILTTYSFAQDSITLGGVSVKLGDKKADIIPMFEKSHQIQNIENRVFVRSKDDHVLGFMSFRNDEVIDVNKHYGHFYEKESLQILEALIEAISSITDKNNLVQISVTRTPYTGDSSGKVVLSTGKRILEFALQANKGIYIIETLGP
jgi:hypothetical protein